MEPKSNFEFGEEFKRRTKAFALQVMRLADGLPATPPCRTAGMQVVRSGTSVAANYRAACRARSAREFVAKLHIALEEADETVLWLELLNEGGSLPSGKLDDLLAEAQSILAVIGKAEKTARANQRNNPTNNS